MTETTWIPAFPLDDLPPGSARVARHERLRIAVFRDTEGALFAVDNRCPHEGYPLVKGAVDGHTLTCCWHNYKFDLRDGSCIKGEEAVRSFPLRVQQGQIELDITPPDPALEIARLWPGFFGALAENRLGQACRDGGRLLELGVSPAQLALAIAADDGARSEWGASHALPVAADALRWCTGPDAPFAGLEAIIPLAQAMDLVARAHPRRPAWPLPPVIDPGPEPDAAARALRARVEVEDMPGAVGLLRGALARGWDSETLCDLLDAPLADHFLSFGHRVIYQEKLRELLRAAEAAGPIPPQQREAVLCGHLRGILNGTREDVLPPWDGLHTQLARLDLEALAVALDSPAEDALSTERREALVRAFIGGSQAEAIDALADAVRTGADRSALVDALSLAAAERMLAFEVTLDSDQSLTDGWLSVSHLQTHAAALRTAVLRAPAPRALRLLLLGLQFIWRHHPLDTVRGQRPPLPTPAEGDPELLADALEGAIARQDTQRALALGRGLLATPEGTRALRQRLLRLAVSDRWSVDIVVAHVMKNTIVALDEYAAMGDERSILAGLRMLASPLQQRWVERRARESVRFLRTGKVPRSRVP